MIHINLTIKDGTKVVKKQKLLLETEQDVENKRHIERCSEEERKMYDSLPAGLPEVYDIEVTL
mgnify:CR=1 FL=1|tara:strand:+ start:571 stop:759 length:189 start_codon:yes stop_codon:yes gene_type:complete